MCLGGSDWAEGRGQRAEGTGQRAEDREQRTEGGIHEDQVWRTGREIQRGTARKIERTQRGTARETERRTEAPTKR